MYSIETRCIHGEKHNNPDQNYSISYPIYQTASFSHLTPGHNPTGFDYSRESNPTRRYLEETMSSLEGANDTIAYASGMAAISAFFEYFSPGDHILCGEDLYGGVVRLIELVCKKNRYEVEYVDTTDINAIEKNIKPNTKAIYFETPTNPMMKETNIPEVAKIASKYNVLVAVDNTFMTPYFRNPIKDGADIVLHSGTKYISGHNDTVCGFLCCKTKELSDRFRLLSKTTGATLGPFECWLVLRGLKTLAVRMDRHSSNAREIKAWLEKRDDVDKVFYAGSGMISFYVNSADKALSILKNIKLITFAESLGGTESLLTYPVVQTHPDVPVEQREKIGINDRLLRLSVGLEAPSDLIDDLEKAFNA